MELNELIKNVQQWSIDRGLDKADSKKQLLKFYEEFGELASGIAKNKPDVIMDSIGDCVVVLIILAQQQGIEVSCNELDVTTGDVYDIALLIGDLTQEIAPGYYRTSNNPKEIIGDIIRYLQQSAKELKTSFEDCLEMAWNAIEDRKGKLVDGVWVKEEDLPAGEVSPEQTLDAVVEDEAVNNPSHYQGLYGLEVVDVLRNFLTPEGLRESYKRNVIEYVLRSSKKNGVEDLKKARKNLDWLIEELENGQKNQN